MFILFFVAVLICSLFSSRLLLLCERFALKPKQKQKNTPKNTAAAEDLSITRIAGLTWDQWNARLAMPLVTQLREGAMPIMFPTDLSVSPSGARSSGGDNSGGGNGGSSGSIDDDKSRHQSESPDKNVSGDNQQSYPCPECGRMYKLKSSLRNHQKWECGKDPQFQCPFCVYRAKQKMHIGRHMERMHKEKYIKIEGDHVIALKEEDGRGVNLNLTV